MGHISAVVFSFYFGHVARLDDNTPANKAVQLHVNTSLSWPLDRTWRCPPGRPWKKWLDQLRDDCTCPIADFWRRAVGRGHGCATTRRPSPATHYDDYEGRCSGRDKCPSVGGPDPSDAGAAAYCCCCCCCDDDELVSFDAARSCDTRERLQSAWRLAGTC